jgi:hypothetical protein
VKRTPKTIILLPLQKSNNRAPCLFFPKSLCFLSLGISSKSRQLTPFSWDVFSQIENEFLYLSSQYKYISLIGDFNGRTSVEKDYFLFDEKDETNTFSDFDSKD